jgi:hypothetical protein
METSGLVVSATTDETRGETNMTTDYTPFNETPVNERSDRMTVGKLIEILKTMPLDTPVFVDDHSEVHLMLESECCFSESSEFTTSEDVQYEGPSFHITVCD